MRSRQRWSICTLLLVTAVGCVSAVGCSSSDPPANDHSTGNAGAGGVAGSSSGASSAGASGMIMPSQMGNGSPGGQSGAAGLGGGGGSGGIVGAGGSSLGGGAGGSALSHGGAGGAGMSTGGSSAAGAGMPGSSGMSGGAGASGVSGEMGRLVGMTAAHNAVRAAVDSNTPLPPLVWSDKLAQYAQQWADELASTSCSSPHHRTSQELQAVGYGENLAAYISSSVDSSTAQQAVTAWASEKTCYTFGGSMTTDQCDTACYTALHSDGCGHYTQIVWRKSTSVGCGVATCQNGKESIWICNYSPPGNYVGQNPY